MYYKNILVSLSVLISLLLVANALFAQDQTQLDNLFFLHHSTGRNIIYDGNLRDYLNNYNSQHNTSFEFWDHDYNDSGLYNPQGNQTGTSYQIPFDNTDPQFLHYLWTSPNADALNARNQILNNHEVISFKSCFPNADITSDDQLQQYKNWYIDIRNVLIQHTTKNFILMSIPPLVPEATNPANANRARAFAQWLKSYEFLQDYPNLSCFDLFDLLASPANAFNQANMLRSEYRLNSQGDSHPNLLANQTIAPLLAQFFIDHSSQESLAFNLISFACQPDSIASSIIINWSTENETQLLGFNLYRSTDFDTLKVLLNQNIILPNNTSNVNNYAFYDSNISFDTLYYYWLKVFNVDGNDSLYGPVQCIYLNSDNQIDNFALSGLQIKAYPNPFNPSICLDFTLKKDAFVTLEIYNLRGQHIISLATENFSTGNHKIYWNGKDKHQQTCASGVYFYKISDRYTNKINKILLLK